MDAQGEDLLWRTTEEIWYMIAQVFNEKWNFLELKTAKMEAYKSTMDEMKQLVAIMGDNPNQYRETIDYLNSKRNK